MNTNATEISQQNLPAFDSELSELAGGNNQYEDFANLLVEKGQIK